MSNQDFLSMKLGTYFDLAKNKRAMQTLADVYGSGPTIEELRTQAQDYLEKRFLRRTEEADNI